MIVRWPGHVAAGATCRVPITFADMLPTLTAIAGADPPRGLDGVDVSPTFAAKDQPQLSSRFLYWEFYKNRVVAQSARRGRWKALRDPMSQAIELYDLEQDVAEAKNVADSHQDMVEEFAEFFRTARSESRDWPMNTESTSTTHQPKRATRRGDRATEPTGATG